MDAIRRFLVKLCHRPKSVGKQGEVLAYNFIKKRGYSIVARNWRFSHGEIDIIAENSGVIVFIEVRLRRKGAFVRGYESISRSKKAVLRRACFAYLKKYAKREPSYRFDVVDIEHDYETHSDIIHHYENVSLFR
ncbi:MAG: YraN family protein [Puniceicoccales bacterium]|jgi:putative endonuclease|nr:YraN family protein [Puniceicoccales bacterium]